jgi:hypothetical protein
LARRHCALIQPVAATAHGLDRGGLAVAAPSAVHLGTFDIVVVLRSWRTPDDTWLIDMVADEPGITYRVWREGEPVGDVAGDEDALRDWLTARHVDLTRLVTAEGDDPFCE